MVNRIPAFILLFWATAVGGADTAARFDVATLKRSPPPGLDSYSINLGTLESGRLNLTNVTLSDCLKFAYGLVSDDQISAPDWARSKTLLFDIVAQIPPNASRARVMLMTQALLADRLGLRVHYEQEERRYLALVPAKGGPKMQVADAGDERRNSGGNGRLNGNQVPMSLLSTMLSRQEHITIVDQTGLKEEYRINLKWAPGSAGPDAAFDSSSSAPSLFAAVQEQLGLKLEARKGPLDILVVDNANQTPADN